MNTKDYMMEVNTELAAMAFIPTFIGPCKKDKIHYIYINFLYFISVFSK
jgi:hypothetical protein